MKVGPIMTYKKVFSHQSPQVQIAVTVAQISRRSVTVRRYGSRNSSTQFKMNRRRNRCFSISMRINLNSGHISTSYNIFDIVFHD